MSGPGNLADFVRFAKTSHEALEAILKEAWEHDDHFSVLGYENLIELLDAGDAALDIAAPVWRQRLNQRLIEARA